MTARRQGDRSADACSHCEGICKRRTGRGEQFGAQAATIQYAEAFEITEYGHQPSEKEIRKMFPFFPEMARAEELPVIK